MNLRTYDHSGSSQVARPAKISPERHTSLVLLVIILGIAAVVRFWELGAQSLWVDELCTVEAIQNNSIQSVLDRSSTDVHPPGYYLFLYFLKQWLGDSETILRMPSAVAGTLAVWMLFLIGAQLYSSREGLMAAALMAVSPYAIVYSQEARSYSLLVLFSAIAVYLWILLIRRWKRGINPSLKLMVGYTLTAIVTAYLHYFGMCFIALLGTVAAVFVVRNRKSLICLLGIYGILIIAYLPWLPAMINQIRSSTSQLSWIQASGNMLAELNAYLDFLLVWPAKYLVLLFPALATYHRMQSRKMAKSSDKDSSRHDAGILLWLIGPFIIVYLGSRFSVPFLTHRNLLISMPAAYLVLSRSISMLPVRRELHIASTVLLMFFSVYQLSIESHYYTQPNKEQFREAVHDIVVHDHLYPDSLVIGYSWSPDYFNYYFKQNRSIRRIDLLAGREGDIQETTKAIAVKNPRYIWFVFAGAVKVPEQAFVDYLMRNFKLLRRQHFFNAQTWLFET